MSTVRGGQGEQEGEREKNQVLDILKCRNK